MNVRVGLQAIWHEIARINWENRPAILDRPTWRGWDKLTNPGYVGRGYEEGGVVFVAMNPANGDKSGPTSIEEPLFSALARMKQSAGAFEEFTAAYHNGLCYWDVARYMREMDAPLEKIGFLNIIPWRTDQPQSGDWKTLAARGWPLLKRQLDTMKPKHTIVLGSATTYELLPKDFRERFGQQVVWKRARQDNHTPEETAAKMADFKKRRGW